MGARGHLRSGLAALALVGFAFACEGEAERTFYNDLDATDGTAPADVLQGGGDAGEDGGSHPAMDATLDGTADTGAERESGPESGGEDGGMENDAADASRDGATGDSAADAAPEAEAGCGPLDTPANCGACGRACDSTHSQGASCNNGTSCSYTGCAAGYEDCDASAPNTSGCDTPITTPVNCTGCGIACDTTNSLDAGCDGGTCTYGGCKPGFANCTTTAPDNNGCETPITTPTNCTGCGVACDTAHSHGAGCNGTACTYTGCASGYGDCDPSAPNSNGCETAITTPTNCGACGVACGGAAQHVAAGGATCTAGVCSYTCAANWNNCNLTPPDTRGCECNTPTCCMDAGLGFCQTTHATGFPSLNYYDCNPLATASEAQSKLLTQAIEACTAYTGAVSQCATGLTCTGSPTVGPYVCDGMGGASCSTCWSYGGTDILKTENCSCPPDITVIGTWN